MHHLNTKLVLVFYVMCGISRAIILGKWFCWERKSKLMARKFILGLETNTEQNVLFCCSQMYYGLRTLCDSKWLFTVVLKISVDWNFGKYKIAFFYPNHRDGHFFFPFFSFCKLKRLFLFFKLPSSAQIQTMQPCCGSVRRGAILFYTVPGRQANHQ